MLIIICNMQVLVVDKKEGEFWLKAELHGKEGFVPANYIQVKKHP